jgi:multidrug efflux pump subunit AcrA (membrane-fusion protein)
MSFRRWVAVGSVALALLASCGCGGRRAAGDEDGGESGAAVVAPVRLGAVEARSFADVVTASGQWRSGGELVLSAPSAGIVESLGVHVGDRVSAGERLGALVTRDSWAALQGAELMRREADGPAARAEAEHALALARRELVRLPLRAPQAGVVVRRSIEPGAQAAEGAEVVALVPDRGIVFEAHVAAADAPRVRVGLGATVAGAGAAPRLATVQRVLPMANSADQSTLVWLAPRDPDPPPELDRFGTATIVVGSSRRALAVPDSAIVEDDLTGERRVARVDSTGRIAWEPVTPGLAADGWREVSRSRLQAGTRIVLEGQRGLPDGTRVGPRP